MTENSSLVAIVAAPGHLRDGLAALLSAAIPQIEVVGHAGNRLSATKVVEEQSPDLILLEASSSSEEIQDLLRRIKTARPQIRCIVLVNDVQQREAITKGAGADAVLVTGYPAAKIVKTVRQLLRQETLIGG